MDIEPSKTSLILESRVIASKLLHAITVSSSNSDRQLGEPWNVLKDGMRGS